MTNLIIEISKYFMIFMFAFYTYECFAAFRQKIKPEQREHILSRQCAAIFLIHFDAFAVIYLVTEDISILVFYAAQAVLLAMIQTCYQLFYSRSSRLLTNNLCMLLTIGFIMLTRLSFDSARKQYFIALVSMIFSLIIPVLINRVGFVRKLYWLFAIVGILALLVVTIAGNTSYGAKISLSIAGISIQPSEFVKILFVFFVAGMLYQDTSFQRVCVTTVIAAIHVLILVASRDLGAALLFFVTYVVMLYVATKKVLYFAGGLAAGSAASVVAYHLFSHIRVRVRAWQNPLAYIDKEGYQISQSLFAIGTGGWFGMGLYQGLPDKIPVVKQDFIFSAVSEELGGIFALCLHIAHDCNLACRYCFAEEGEYHGRRALMSFEVGKKALDFLVANSGNRVNLEVDFFGGEPLMNWDVVKQLVEYGRSLEKPNNKKFRFTLTTNGILLNDEILEFVNKEMGNIVLSIDGRKEINDKMRPFRGGQGSYDIIVPKFQKVAESRDQMNYYVRGTFTHNNLDFSKDVLHLADLGFKQISVEPVVAQPTDDYAIREEDIPILKEEYDKLAVEMIKRKKEGKAFNFFHFMIDLQGGPCVAKRLSGCGSGTEYLAVTPWGDLYPCHQFVGNEKFLMGNVDTGVVRDDIRDEFKCCNVYAKDKCKKCFAKFYCSGGCAANSYNFHGNINDAYDIGCELQRKRIECAIMLKAAEAAEASEE